MYVFLHEMLACMLPELLQCVDTGVLATYPECAKTAAADGQGGRVASRAASVSELCVGIDRHGQDVRHWTQKVV